MKDIENNLKIAGLMDNDDSLITTERGNFWKKTIFLNSKVRGYYYFTEKRIIFIGGFASSTQWSIKYKDIKNIQKNSIFGIIMETEDENGKIIKYKLSLLKRNYWFDYIQSNMN